MSTYRLTNAEWQVLKGRRDDKHQYELRDIDAWCQKHGHRLWLLLKRRQRHHSERLCRACGKLVQV